MKLDKYRREGTSILPAVGDWYNVEGKLMCVAHVGSNYVRFQDIHSHQKRVHFDNLIKKTKPVHLSVAKRFFQKKIKQAQRKMTAYLAEVQELVRQLAVGDVGAQADSTALVAMHQTPDVKLYKQALQLAAKEQLPALQQKIKESADEARHWAKFELTPLEVRSSVLQTARDSVLARSEQIGVYAGLEEELICIQDGEPAAYDTPVHIMQRKLFADEEAIVDFPNGEINWSTLDNFFAWLKKPRNLQRLLPHPRTMMAMQVRRYPRHIDDLAPFVRVWEEVKASANDTRTLVFLRNGDQVWCANTNNIEFGEVLFTSTNDFDSDEPLFGWHSMSSNGWNFVKQSALRVDADTSNIDERVAHEYRRYQRFDPTNVFYDDMLASVSARLREKNKVIVLLQGILDRSTALHPHPPWKLWTQDFETAVCLVFDAERGLTTPRPDFKAWRLEKNKGVKPGDRVIGARTFYINENRQWGRDSAMHNWRVERKAPPHITKVERAHRDGSVTISWFHERDDLEVDAGLKRKRRCLLRLPPDAFLSLHNYSTDDYKQFFDHPESRAHYIQWAPILMLAERYIRKQKDQA